MLDFSGAYKLFANTGARPDKQTNKLILFSECFFRSLSNWFVIVPKRKIGLNAFPLKRQLDLWPDGDVDKIRQMEGKNEANTF